MSEDHDVFSSFTVVRLVLVLVVVVVLFLRVVIMFYRGMHTCPFDFCSSHTDQ